MSSCSNLLVPPFLAMRAHYPPGDNGDDDDDDRKKKVDKIDHGKQLKCLKTIDPPPPSPGPLQLLFLSEQRAVLILLLLRPAYLSMITVQGSILSRLTIMK